MSSSFFLFLFAEHGKHAARHGKATEQIVTGNGSTWDYLPDDLTVSGRPQGMNVKAYEAVKKRMRALEDAERIVYPFHPLHRIGNGYFDTKVCMYNAHFLLKNVE